MPVKLFGLFLRDLVGKFYIFLPLILHEVQPFNFLIVVSSNKENGCNIPLIKGAIRKVIINGDFFVYNPSLFHLFIDFIGSSPVEGLVIFRLF